MTNLSPPFQTRLDWTDWKLEYIETLLLIVSTPKVLFSSLSGMICYKPSSSLSVSFWSAKFEMLYRNLLDSSPVKVLTKSSGEALMKLTILVWKVK